MSLRSVNLNLIPVLQVLLRERSLTRASAILGLTQSALSMSLAKLRQSLDDPLLVREGREMVLTVKAKSLLPMLDLVCDNIEAIFPNSQFDPRAQSSDFVLSSSDNCLLMVAPDLIATLHEHAPEVTLHLVDNPHDDLEPHSGEVDFFLVPRAAVDGERFPNIRYETVFRDRFVAVVSRERAMAGTSLGADAPAAIYYPGVATPDRELLQALAGGLRPRGRIAARAQHFVLLLAIAAQTGCVAFVPERLAQQFHDSFAFEILDLNEAGADMEVVLAWYVNQQNRPRHRWMRNLIVERCRQRFP